MIRWNQALEQLYGPTRGEAIGRPLEQLFDPAVVGVLQRASAAIARRRHRVPRPADRRGGRERQRRCWSTSRRCRCSRWRRPRPASARIVIFEDITERDAARGAAAHLGEDGLARPAGRGRRPRGQHAADRHLQLHADAARAGRTPRTRAPPCSRRSRSRPSAPPASSTGCCTCRAATPPTHRERTRGRPQRRRRATCCRCSSTSSRRAA